MTLTIPDAECLIVFSGLISSVVMFFVGLVLREYHSTSIWYSIASVILLLNPYYAVSSALMRYSLIALGNRGCTLCGKDAPPDCEYNFFCFSSLKPF